MEDVIEAVGNRKSELEFRLFHYFNVSSVWVNAKWRNPAYAKARIEEYLSLSLFLELAKDNKN